MFKIKSFSTHVLLTNSWAMKLNAQGVECQSNSVCIAFFNPRGLNANHCPIQVTCWAFLHALFEWDCFECKTSFIETNVKFKFQCQSAVVKHLKSKSSEIKRDISRISRKPQPPELMQTKLCDKMSSPSQSSFSTATDVAMHYGNENPAALNNVN